MLDFEALRQRRSEDRGFEQSGNPNYLWRMAAELKAEFDRIMSMLKKILACAQSCSLALDRGDALNYEHTFGASLEPSERS